MTRIVVDPVTRIEGHLRLKRWWKRVITDAFSSGTMVRGWRRSHRPRSSRRLGHYRAGLRVCTTVHALASVRAVEDALGVAVPPTAE